ncbi:hypothetical protein DdX_20880 [Ditylenchus destructor]|uniref:F-box domain-containing protein n=1 Tax=Ditylenchus destructor TaxID=166010 RepID=A0AAD4QVR5_9BILA|nr:hypothetical protein DdX_20880 [Ditylenchus destructor]
MSNSKPLPPFTFDVLYYLNRNQLERFSIVCRPLKNLIDRYFGSKPYRILDELYIRGGSCALIHNDVKWPPNRDDYNAQQFLATQKCDMNSPWKKSWRNFLNHSLYHLFAEMGPYFGPTIRIKKTWIYVAGDSTYNPEQIAEMESIAYLWSDGNITIWDTRKYNKRIVAEDFQPILNSPTILQCQKLWMYNAHFSFKDYKVLYTVKMIENYNYGDDIDHNSWTQFLEQPGVKPLVVLRVVRHVTVANVIDRISKAFSSAVSPNIFKIVFAELDDPLTEFRETNNTSGEILELKKGIPVDYLSENLEQCNNYTLERSSI